MDNYLLCLLAVQLICDGQWWLAESSKWWKSTERWKKCPLSHQKMKNSFLFYVQLLMINQVIQATKVIWNPKKGPLSHQKNKILILDYVQLLMIGQVIRVMKVDQNANKWHVFQLGSSVVSVRVFCCFGQGLLLFQTGSSVCSPTPHPQITR